METTFKQFTDSKRELTPREYCDEFLSYADFLSSYNQKDVIHLYMDCAIIQEGLGKFYVDIFNSSYQFDSLKEAEQFFWDNFADEEFNDYEHGYHTPKATTYYKGEIEKATGVKFDDSSWCNDLCDSISNLDLDITIYMPNSENKDIDNEEFNTFNVYAFEVDDIQHEFKTLQEVIEHIESINKMESLVCRYEDLSDEDKLHEDARQMMEDLNDKYELDSHLSLDEYLMEHWDVLNHKERDDVIELIHKF